MEKDIDFFETAAAGLRVQKVDNRNSDCVTKLSVECSTFVTLTHKTAKITYVRHVMLRNAIGVMSTTTKLDSQFAAVAMALAGPRIGSGVSSTAQSQLRPCQPIAKKVLKTKTKTVKTRCDAVVSR